MELQQSVRCGAVDTRMVLNNRKELRGKSDMLNGTTKTEIFHFVMIKPTH